MKSENEFWKNHVESRSGNIINNFIKRSYEFKKMANFAKLISGANESKNVNFNATWTVNSKSLTRSDRM